MPPRSYYNEPRPSDYVAFAHAFFPEELEQAKQFTEKYGLPYVASSAHVAAYLGVSSSLVRQIIHKPSYHHREFPLKKTSGGERLISTPKTYLKVIQWWISDNIINKFPLEDCVHGFRPGRSYFTNAAAHLGAKNILNVDIKSFFDSIKLSAIANVFSALGYPEGGCLALAALTSKDGVAPTGAPTSPMIANAIFTNIDKSLAGFAAERGLIYTRYADDLTFSADEWIEPSFVEEISKIVALGGFELNSSKTRFMGPGNRQEVTGLVTNTRISLPKEWRNSARGFLHRVQSNPLENLGHLGRVHGLYGVLLQCDPEKQRQLTVQAEQAMLALKRAKAASKAATGAES
jgi:RNA-directed DNA polymerase